MPKRVVVVGGGGFLGSRAVESLKTMADLSTEIASRRSALRVDLADRSTFDALLGTDIVVDLADATSTPPDELALWCATQGITFVETTSDMAAVNRLRKLALPADATGSIVLGAGIFTGLSNLLANAVARAANASSLVLGIRTSPFSGAGKGTIALMASMLSINAFSTVDGCETEHPPVGKGPRLPFITGEAPSLRVPMAEEVMLPSSTGVANIDVYFAPKPALLVASFRALPFFVLKSSIFGAFMRGYFTFLRRFVLAKRATTCELLAIGQGDCEVRRSIVAPDGMGAGGIAIAAIVAEIASRTKPAGVVMVDQVVELDPVVTRMEKLSPGTIQLG